MQYDLDSGILVELNNGDNRYVLSHRDICDIIKEETSFELGNIVEQELTYIDTQAIEAKAKVEAETEYYEQSVEELSNAMWDIIEQLREVADEVADSKRLNKSKLVDKLNNIADSAQHIL